MLQTAQHFSYTLADQAGDLLGTLDRIREFRLKLERIAIIPLMGGFKENRTDLYLAHACTLASTQLQYLEIVVVSMIAQDRSQFFRLDLHEVRQQIGEIGALHPVRPGKECLTRFAVSGKGRLHPFHCLLDPRRGYRWAFERQRSACHGVPAEMQLVMRHQLAMHALAFPVYPDISSLGLGAPVM